MTRWADVRCHRAISLCNEALHTLCCGKGDIRSRLFIIDREFFCLKPEEFPDIGGLRSEFKLLSRSVRKLRPKGNEGSLNATISKSRLNTLENIAEKIWDIHHMLNTYVKVNDEDSTKAPHTNVEEGELPFPNQLK